MAIDRAAALKNAEKLLRQGKLDQAIEEYVRIVEDQATDWNTRNTLGDLLVRAGQLERAVAEYVRIADAFKNDGFLSKAAALYRKVLKFKPDDEHAALQAAEIAASQGLLADARTALNAVAERRRARGDTRGVLTLVVRLAALDPGDVDAGIRGARAMVELGDPAGALGTLRTLLDDLREKKRHDRIAEVLQELSHLAPDDHAVVLEMIETRLALNPHDIDALSRLVEIAVDEGLDDRLPDAQSRLAEAHLTAGSAIDARFIAEDLVVRYPDDETHVQRLRRVLSALGEADVEGVISNLRHPHAVVDSASEPVVIPVADAAPPPQPVAKTAAPPVPQVPIPPPAANPPEMLAAPPVSRPATIAQAQHRSPNIEIDLSVVLDQIHKAPLAPPSAEAAPDLDDVFAQMRDEARRRLAIESAEQDFRRGVALFQAGQVEESIAAFESASTVPRFRFETASLLGRIFLNRGDLARAVDWLDRAAEAPAHSPDDRHKVLYNLADALESSGDTARALAVLLELQASAGVFRDVRARITRLSTTQTRG